MIRKVASHINYETEIDIKNRKFKGSIGVAIQNPARHFPHAGFFENAIWMTLQPKRLKNINSGGGRGGSYHTDKDGPVYKFLAPEEIMEVHNHEYEEWESILTRLLEMYVTFKKGTSQAGQIADDVVDSGKAAFNEVKEVLGTKGRKLSDIPVGVAAKEHMLRAISTDYDKFKIDSPLAYKGSARRQWQFTFQLVQASLFEIPLVKIVKDIEKYAAPTGNDTLTSYDLPHIWKIRSTPNELIDIDYAALTSIQPTWKGPYIRGYPVRCELTLSFTDARPLLSNYIRYGGILEVVSENAEAIGGVKFNVIISKRINYDNTQGGFTV